MVLHQYPRQPRWGGAGRPRILQIKGRNQVVGARSDSATAVVSAALRRRLSLGANQLLSAARRRQGGLGQHRSLRMARLPNADQDRLLVPRLNPRGAAGARPGAVPRPRPSRRHARNPGVALVLLQGTDGRAGALPRARRFYSAHETQEYPSLDAW